MVEASNDYEAWVLGLQAWAKDPSHDLGGLPRLSADSLPPAAYERLVAHIMAAQQEVMSAWQRRLERNIQAARSEHEYARTLVELRSQLGRRLQLARHHGLPAEIQRPLSDGVERDIRRIQQELENAVTQPGRGNGIQMATREKMLRLVRANSFTAILKPEFPLESLFVTMTSSNQDPASSEPSPSSTVRSAGPKRVTRRRVVLDDG
jgi:hypothetical protein